LQNNRSKIIVAPLNWGIGHATRCVPIINDLLKKGFEPIIATDGNALKYLKQEFPLLTSYELPSYNIVYSNNQYLFKIKLFFQINKIKKAVADEHQVIQKIIKKEGVKGIISDNRFGAYSKEITSVYITHQLNVLSGITTFFTSKIHQKIMGNFNEIWVADLKTKPKLAGKLSSNSKIKTPVKYIGLLSRFSKNNTNITLKNYKYDLLVLLSGIEPQRTMLEKKLIKELKNYPKKIIFIRGFLGKSQYLKNTDNIEFINFLSKKKLAQIILNSKIVLSRSGYSTIMDLASLQKKAFFIPTSGQTEQEYLAKHLEKLKISPFSKQNSFKIAMLNRVENYTGFTQHINITNLDFNLFQ